MSCLSLGQSFLNLISKCSVSSEKSAETAVGLGNTC